MKRRMGFILAIILGCTMILGGCQKNETRTVEVEEPVVEEEIQEIPQPEIIQVEITEDKKDEKEEEKKEEKVEEKPKEENKIVDVEVTVTDARMNGVWVATVKNIDYPTLATADSTSLMAQADTIINNCANMGINNIFLQVRPTGDAFYKSSIYPWSRYLTGVQGCAPSNDFDPLAYWIKQCHAKGIKLHAWVNPYRITRENDGADTEFAAFPATNPAKQHPEWVVKHENNYYFNPGIPEVRQMVINGVMEIVNNYEVDGIHFDDYFYPQESNQAFNDDATFAQYGAGYSSKAQWRRDNVNQLVSVLKPTIQSVKPNVVFGISPSGIWCNSTTTSEGSLTNGMESYTQLFADTRKWAKEGWVDYICPQIYWSIGFAKADYQVLVDWWSRQVEGSSTTLYIGMCDYRTTTTDPSNEWYGAAGVDMIKKELDLNLNYPNVKGEIHYNYTNMSQNAPLLQMYQQR